MMKTAEELIRAAEAARAEIEAVSGEIRVRYALTKADAIARAVKVIIYGSDAPSIIRYFLKVIVVAEGVKKLTLGFRKHCFNNDEV